MVFERLLPFEEKLVGRRVLVTGNTGFTGSWVSLWLHGIGAKTFGLALHPDTSPSLFDVLALSETMTVFRDVTDFAAVRTAIEEIQPHLILHLAAQPLVRRSYREPARTFDVNARERLMFLKPTVQPRVLPELCASPPI